MTAQPIRIGTRGSSLALVQAALVARALAACGHAHRVVIVETAGDRRAPDTPWGEGAFVAAIEQALLDGRVDVAVHSAKDVPTAEDPRLRIGAYLERADPRDALVLPRDRTGTLDTLPAGSVVGTDSPRRAGFVLARRPDLVVRPIHGNVDTRLRRLDEGAADALVLAVAGLERLGLGHRIVEHLDPSVIPPAPGQGAIAVQFRADDAHLGPVLAAIDHRATRAAVTAERALLHALGGGCRAPIGSLATVDGSTLQLATAIVDGDRPRVTRAVTTGIADAPEAAAIALAARIRPSLETTVPLESADDVPTRTRVIVTRPDEQADELVAAMREAGLVPVTVPAIRIAPIDPNPTLDEALLRAAHGSRVVVTSANGAQAALASLGRMAIDPGTLTWAAIGTATRRILEAGGVSRVWQPSSPDAGTLAAELPLDAGSSVIRVRGALADGDLAEAWRRRGASVVEIVAYRTELAPASSVPLLDAALDGPPAAAVVFASGSAVDGLLRLAGHRRPAVLALPAICIGPRTAAAARAAGFSVVGSGVPRDATGLAVLTARLVRDLPVGASS
ncbi:MAG TPA: hydroxymethylbilane synthase [Candidatus Limnocylindrales bacterium]|nr:hydroxymethylbilane synthase [Candidatus Limnocylindrales bacterium]